MAGDGCITHAGILTPGEGKLTKKAKTKFIQAVKDELKFGTANLPTPPLFPCGDPIPPVEHADLLELEDEAKFPDFHKHVLGSYEQIAQSLDLASDFKFLPICCPVSLGLKLGIKFRLKFPGGFIPFLTPALPLLALKMKLMPPFKLALKFPSLPSIPPPLPKFKLPPSFDIGFLPELFKFTLAFSLGIPAFLVNLALQIPKLILKVPSLPDLFKLVCKIAFDSKLFGDIQPSSVTEIAAVKVLTTKVVECSFIAATGTTLGSSPGGITGGVGKFLGYDPPPDDDPDQPDDPRTLIVDFANESDGLSWSSDSNKYTETLLYREYGDGNPPDGSPQSDKSSVGRDRAIARCQAFSSCGLFVRACYFNGGATEDFFVGTYVDGTAISGILDIGKQKGALIPFSSNSFPALQPGDSVLIGQTDQHILLITQDYPGGLGGPLVGVEGGQVDAGNNNLPTLIQAATYDIFSVQAGQVIIGKSSGNAAPPRPVVAIFDGEKMVAEPT